MSIWIYNKIIFKLKQLLPMTYHTTFKQDGVRKLSIWKMWLGRCYDIKEYTIVKED